MYTVQLRWAHGHHGKPFGQAGLNWLGKYGNAAKALQQGWISQDQFDATGVTQNPPTQQPPTFPPQFPTATPFPNPWGGPLINPQLRPQLTLPQHTPTSYRLDATGRVIPGPPPLTGLQFPNGTMMSIGAGAAGAQMMQPQAMLQMAMGMGMQISTLGACMQRLESRLDQMQGPGNATSKPTGYCFLGPQG